MKRLLNYFFLGVLCFTTSILTSCSDDNDGGGNVAAPEILSSGSQSPTAPYMGKVGRPLTLHPIVKNTNGATYTWTRDGGIVGTDSTYTLTEAEACELTFLFKVENPGGSAEENIEVRIMNLVPPIIEFLLEDKHIQAALNRPITFEPLISGADSQEWLLDNKKVGSEMTYTFVPEKLGKYDLVLRAINEDGISSDTLHMEVLEFITPQIDFNGEEIYVVKGREARITPKLKNVEANTTYQWTIDGKVAGNKNELTFKPEDKEEYLIGLTVTNPDNYSTTKEVRLLLIDEPKARPITASSQAAFDKVYEFLPAPGQFVNEGYTCRTMAEACAYAERQMRIKPVPYYVSLGGFGGYIVIGFDHSVIKHSTSDLNDKTYDFAIVGNAFKGSSEPGIIWVMQDENGNGLPDDTWYELAGSESGKTETTQNYSVTYYRPKAYAATRWTDSKGESGTVDRPVDPSGIEFHKQAYYYPLWVKEDSYTLKGTLLKHRTVDETGPLHPGSWQYWVNNEFDWGYADNFGKDRLNYTGDSDDNHDAGNDPIGFKIANAIDASGNKIDLKFIDFVKVQTGVNVKAGWLGENSTEVFDFYDLHMNK